MKMTRKKWLITAGVVLLLVGGFTAYVLLESCVRCGGAGYYIVNEGPISVEDFNDESNFTPKRLKDVKTQFFSDPCNKCIRGWLSDASKTIGIDILPDFKYYKGALLYFEQLDRWNKNVVKDEIEILVNVLSGPKSKDKSRVLLTLILYWAQDREDSESHETKSKLSLSRLTHAAANAIERLSNQEILSDSQALLERNIFNGINNEISDALINIEVKKD